jgi:arginase
MSLGQPLLGADKSPLLFRENRLQNLLASCGWRVNLVPDVVSPMVNNVNNDGNDGSELNAKNCAEIGAISQRVSQQVLEHAQTKNFLLMLGGDHSISIGTVPGIMAARKNTGIVWVDAHADINTPVRAH